jgi:hypothetical protein
VRVRNLIATGLAALCAAPSAIVNVLPHAAAMVTTRDLAGEAGALSFQAVAVIAMAGMPFALRKTRDFAMKTGLFALASILLFLNFLNALDVASHVRDEATGANRGTLAQAAGLKSRIAELANSRAQVPFFEFTSPAMVEAQREAVAAANTARDAECKKVGDKCRQRQDAASAEVAKLASLVAQRTLTDRAGSLDGQIAEAKGELLRLGPLPKHADGTAANLTRIVGLVMPVASGTDEAISEWRPILFAFGIELLAFLGPAGMITAFGMSANSAGRKVGQGANGERQRKTALLADTKPIAATSTKQKKANKAKKDGLAGVGAVQEWFNSRTAARPGAEIRCNEAYASYIEWCKSQDFEGVSLTKFGSTMKGELQVAYAERSRRGFYVGIALKETPRLKVVAS